MHRRHLTKLLMMPSLSSGMLAVVATGILIAYSAWAHIRSSQSLYDFLFGPYGLQTYFWQQSAQATVAKQAFLGNPAAYYVLVGIAAIIVGLVMYTILQGMSLFVSSMQQIWVQLEQLGPTRRAILRTLVLRLVLRIVSLLGWAVFGAFFFSTLLPSMLILNQTGVAQILAGSVFGWIDCVVAGATLLVAFHVHSVFARLVALRPRLFWGDEAIIEAEA
jgi:flagellar biosynthesis protein FlhB